LPRRSCVKAGQTTRRGNRGEDDASSGKFHLSYCDQ
jgi:hypothetical protein